MTLQSKSTQWLVVVGAIVAALLSQMTNLEKVVSAGVLVWVLFALNVISAVLPALKQSFADAAMNGSTGHRAVQYATVIMALAAAVNTYYQALPLPQAVSVLVLVGTNVVSAVLPAVTGAGESAAPSPQPPPVV